VVWIQPGFKQNIFLEGVVLAALVGQDEDFTVPALF
jgi:hypothetical protein